MASKAGRMSFGRLPSSEHGSTMSQSHDRVAGPASE